MPRTKQSRRVKEDNTIRDFHRLVQMKVNKFDLDCASAIKKAEFEVSMMLNRYPREIQQMTLKEVLELAKENQIPKSPVVEIQESKLPKTSKKNLKTDSSSRTTDDGYLSEASSQSTKSKVLGNLRSRSQDSRATNNLNVNQTPKNKQPRNSFVITPKVKLNSKVNFLRKPIHGEMVFSTEGSPLLVAASINEKTANINIPLKDGKTVSILPFNDSISAEASNLHLDEDTKKQLESLQNLINKVLRK